MSTATVPYEFTNGLNADATKVNADFDAVLAFVNAEVVQRDGAVAMTGALVLSGPPTLDTHAARKQYVDDSFAAYTYVPATDSISYAMVDYEQVRMTKSTVLTATLAAVGTWTVVTDTEGSAQGTPPSVTVCVTRGMFAYSLQLDGSNSNSFSPKMQVWLHRGAGSDHLLAEDLACDPTGVSSLQGVVQLSGGDYLYVMAATGGAADNGNTQAFTVDTVRLA